MSLRTAEQDGPPEDPLTIVREKIRVFLSEEAPDIATQIEDHPLVVVTGPMRNGKTDNLIPAVQRQLQAKGHEVAKFDGQYTTFLPKEEWAEMLPASATKDGILIVDEAGALFEPRREREFIEFAHVQGYSKIIAVAAYPIDDEQAPQKITSRWRDATGKPNAPAIHIFAKLLPSPLAREFVTAHGQFMNSPREAIDYVLSTVPYNVHALSTVSGQRTLQGTIDGIRANVDSWQGAIPKAQLAAVRQKVGPAY